MHSVVEIHWYGYCGTLLARMRIKTQFSCDDRVQSEFFDWGTGGDDS